MTGHFRDLNKKKRIIGSYNSSAHFYDERYRSIQEKKYIKALDKYFLNGKIILDVGCGTGLLFEFILKQGIYKRKLNCNYVAIDISLKMLSEFRSKLLNLEDNTKVCLMLSDIENLPFRDEIFNLIFSFTSFQNLPSLNQGIHELVRVALKNGDLKLSILKKKLNLTSLIDLLKPYLKQLEIDNEEFLEDVIVQGKIVKS